MDPDQVGRVCPECGWATHRPAADVWKSGVRNGQRHWRRISAIVVGIAAMVVVGLGVVRGTSNSLSMRPRPWISAGAFEAIQFVTRASTDPRVDPPVMMGDELVAIAQGRSAGELLIDLIPAPGDLQSAYPAGAELFAMFAEPSASNITTLSWGWPLAWHHDDSSVGYGDFRRDEIKAFDTSRAQTGPQFFHSHIQYVVPAEGYARTLHWDLAGPPAAILSLVLGNLLIRLALHVIWRGRLPSKTKRLHRRIFWAMVLALLLVNLLSIKTESSWHFTSYGQLATAGGYPADPPVMVSQDEVMELSESGSDPSAIARAILQQASSPPTEDQVVYFALAHPKDIESESEGFVMGGLFSPGGTSTGHLVRILPSGASEPIGTQIGKRFSYYARWSSLTVQLPATGGSVRSVTINVANLTVIVFLLWLTWVGVNAIGRVWVRRRTGRRAKRGLCLNCAYEILPA